MFPIINKGWTLEKYKEVISRLFMHSSIVLAHYICKYKKNFVTIMFCLKFYTFFKKFWYWIWFYYASYIQVISLLYHDAMIVWLWRLWLYRTTMILSDYDSIIVYDQFRQKKIVGIWSTNCLLEFWNWHLSFRKKQQDKRKSINQILFSTESTMLNLMMKIWWLQGVQRSFFVLDSYHWSSSMNSSILLVRYVKSRHWLPIAKSNQHKLCSIAYAWLNQAFKLKVSIVPSNLIL